MTFVEGLNATISDTKCNKVLDNKHAKISGRSLAESTSINLNSAESCNCFSAKS